MPLQYLSGAVQVCGGILSFSCGCFWSFASLAIPPTLSLALALSGTCSHALWMSWDTASRVCGVCCLLRSNNSRAPLAPCPAPANSTTPDRRLTCMDSWHGYCPNQIPQSRVEIYNNPKSDVCLQTWLGKLPGAWDGTESQLLPVMRDKQSENVSHVFAKGKASTARSGLQSWECTVESRRDANSVECSKHRWGQFQTWALMGLHMSAEKLSTFTSFPTNASQQPCIWKSCVNAVGLSLCCGCWGCCGCVLPSVAQGICFRANVLIIPQPARVGGLLTHARAIIDRLEQMQAWASPPPEQTVKRGPTPPLHPNTLHVHLKTHMYSECLWMTPKATVL